MTSEKQIQQAEVMIAHAKGKKVEFRYSRDESDKWSHVPDPGWDFVQYEYRVAVPAQEEWKAGDVLRAPSGLVIYEGAGLGDSLFKGTKVDGGYHSDGWIRSHFTLDHRPSEDPRHDLREQHEAAPAKTAEEVRVENNRQVVKDWNDSGKAYGLEFRNLNESEERWFDDPCPTPNLSWLEYRRKPEPPAPRIPHTFEVHSFTWLDGTPCGKSEETK